MIRVKHKNPLYIISPIIDILNLILNAFIVIKSDRNI